MFSPNAGELMSVSGRMCSMMDGDTTALCTVTRTLFGLDSLYLVLRSYI